MKHFKHIRSGLDHSSYELIKNKYIFGLIRMVHRRFDGDLFYYSTLMKYMGV